MQLRKPDTAKPSSIMTLLKMPPEPSEHLMDIPVDKLHHFKGHPFKLYTGERQQDLVSSISTNGIITPLIVRTSGENYEVIAGHNRLVCGQMAGLTHVPCIIRTDLTDEEATIYMAETNFQQRGFSDMSHSERAAALAVFYHATKKQGKRKDLIKAIDAESGQTTLSQIGTKYGLSKNTMHRYIKINELISAFKFSLDKDEITLGTAYALSFLNEQSQHMVWTYRLVKPITETYKMKPIAPEQADCLKKIFQEEGLIGETDLHEIFGNQPIVAETVKVKYKPIKLQETTYSQYFPKDATPETIEETICNALELYYDPDFNPDAPKLPKKQ